MKLKDLLVLRYAGDVKRLHTARIEPQSLAHHQWNVALLLMIVYPDYSKAAMAVALTHDLAELDTGDVPANAKWAEPTLEKALQKLEQRFIDRNALPDKNSLSLKERGILKWCDGAELLLYCTEQVAAGNRYAIEVCHAIRGAMETKGTPIECTDAMACIDWFVRDTLGANNGNPILPPGTRVNCFDSQIYTKDTKR